MDFYGSIDIYQSSTAEIAARMDFQPMQHYVDARVGETVRFCVRFTACCRIDKPRFLLCAGGAVIGSYEAEDIFIPVGEGSPFYVNVPLADVTRFGARVTRLSIGADTADSAFTTLETAECGVDALKWRLAPLITVDAVARCDADGRKRPDGIRGRVENMRLIRREDWSGDASALTVRDVLVVSSGGARYDLTLTDAMLTAALASGYTETIPALLATLTLAAGESWTITFTVGFSQDNVSVAAAVVGEAFANLHLSGAKAGGACFGGFSKSTDEQPMLESRYPAYLYAGLAGLTFYPEEEQAVGTWIDGQPIYAKRFRQTGIAGTSGAASTLMGTLTAARVIGSVGHIVRSDGRMAALPWIIDGSHYAGIDVTGTGEVRLRHCLGSGTTAEVFACVWYCRTQ